MSQQPLKILVVPDKFKGSLTATAAAEAIARGWRTGRSGDHLEMVPMSDGGDGFGEILGQLLGAERREYQTVDAARRPCVAAWWLHESTAIVESANVIGLAQLPQGHYHPFELDTQGLGLLLKEIARQGARRCLVGIGGSATNDAGFGMARALGWQFFNTHREKLDRWSMLHDLAGIRPPENRELFQEVKVAVDVQNPLLGPEGCTRVYGPQKGLQPRDFEFAERGLEKLAEILERELHIRHAKDPGAGAAGGLGFGFASFLEAELVGGFELFSQMAKLEERLEGVDLVLTGEGSIDASTLMGKGVGEVATRCRRKQVPCIGLGGVVTDPDQATKLFAQTHSLTPTLASREEAQTRAAELLEQLSAQVAAGWEKASIS